MKQLKFFMTAFFLNIFLVQNLMSQFSNFISKKDDKLFDGDKEFRFISFNIPNLHYIEDYLPFAETNPWRLPDEFEIRDALQTIKQLGGKVARIYVLSVKGENDSSIIRHVESPGIFNEEAFVALDKVITLANEIGIRIIIPFVDNWSWWGGVNEYAAFRNKASSDFWYDQELISDFKQTINFLLNRKNTITGKLYKDDKAILAWETGNELSATDEWTKKIAAYIKSLDENHLVIEGTYSKELSDEIINDDNIDILSTHHYGNVKSSIEWIVQNQKKAKGIKPYIIGEYGLIPTQDIRAISDTIIRQGLTGGLLWSLRFHNREGGFYHHYEYDNYESYRFPGYASGGFYDEQLVLNLIREKAFAIDNRIPPAVPIPNSPYLFDIEDVSKISWQGSTGAESYVVERKEEFENEWSIIFPNVDESKYQYRTLFNDEFAEIGKRYYYRIKAVNQSGESDYSNVVGPVDVNFKTIIDEMENFNFIFQKDGQLKLLTTEDLRKAKEDRSRLSGNDESYIIYKSPSEPLKIVVDGFASKDSSTLDFYTGSELTDTRQILPDVKVFKFDKNEYGFFDALRFSFENFSKDDRLIKIVLKKKIQISRVEFSYR